MDLEGTANSVGPLSRKVLERLVDDGIISTPFSERDRHLLAALSLIWKDEWYVAQMNKSFKPDKRVMMLAFPNFGKIERYILSSYLNLKPGMKVSVRKMASRIHEHFKLDYPAFKIRQVRQIAYNLRRHERKNSTKQVIIRLALLRKAEEQSR